MVYIFIPVAAASAGASYLYGCTQIFRVVENSVANSIDGPRDDGLSHYPWHGLSYIGETDKPTRSTATGKAVGI